MCLDITIFFSDRIKLLKPTFTKINETNNGLNHKHLVVSNTDHKHINNAMRTLIITKCLYIMSTLILFDTLTIWHHSKHKPFHLSSLNSHGIGL